MGPQIIFGTAMFGMEYSEFRDSESMKSILKILKKLGIHRLDTGARYPPTQPGLSEELIGSAKELSSSFVVDTKVYADMRTDGNGELSREAIQKSVADSLKRLQRPNGVNVLYAHRADPGTALEEQIQAFNEQIEQGHCKTWGVSNTPPDVLEKILALCDEKGWQKPCCYQGDYNMVTRGMEIKLLPMMRAHGMSFVAFRPLAAGFLTGKLLSNEHSGTRFADDNPIGKAAQGVFGAADLRQAVTDFSAAVNLHGMPPMEVAVRWIAHHSALGDGDSIILGASKTAQLEETVALIQKGPLSPELVDLAEQAWRAVEETRGSII